MRFYPRLTPPDEKHPCYTSQLIGSAAITIEGDSVLPNCIGYGIGRWLEIFGKTYGLIGVNGDKFYDYNKQNAQVVTLDSPRLGAIACWDGHIAPVEDYNNRTMLMSQSHWNGERFDTETIDIGADYHGKRFLGFLFPNEDIRFVNEPRFDIYPEYTSDYYRVRKTWEDVASQVGAFHYLTNARRCADETGLTVFAPDGKKVF